MITRFHARMIVFPSHLSEPPGQYISEREWRVKSKNTEVLNGRSNGSPTAVLPEHRGYTRKGVLPQKKTESRKDIILSRRESNMKKAN
jgi:hypothetical protein